MTNKRKYTLIIVVSLVALTIALTSILNLITNNKIEAVKLKEYGQLTTDINKQVEKLIQDKRQMTLSLGLSLARSNNTINSLESGDLGFIKLKEFSKELRENTSYKNVWFQIIDKEGISLYRSWTNKKGDSLLKARMDIAKLIKEPKIVSTISTGKFDMTFKSIVPVYNSKNELVGFFEIITHFNSIIKKLNNFGLEAIALVDKKYKKQIIKPFTDTFVNDYYVANVNADKKIIDILKQNSVEYFVDSNKDFIISPDNQLATMYKVPDIRGDDMGYILTFRHLDSIVINEINTIEKNTLFYTMLIIMLMLFIGYSFHHKLYNNVLKDTLSELEKQKHRISAILDAQSNFIIVTNGISLIETNKSLMKFYGLNSFEEFRDTIGCICNSFIEEEGFLQKEQDGKSWIDVMLKDLSVYHQVKIKDRNGLVHIFQISISELEVEENIYVVTLTDVTEQRKKDLLFLDQSKMASLGDMIGNIAHQWRQPLSAISTMASAMRINSRLGILEPNDIEKQTESIVEKTLFLSETINTFTDFIKDKKELKDVVLQDKIDKAVNIVGDTLNANHVMLINEIDYDNPIYVKAVTGELPQVIINVLNNAKDIFIGIFFVLFVMSIYTYFFQ